MQAYAKEVTAFVDAVVNDTDVPATQDDGLKAVRIGLAARSPAPSTARSRSARSVKEQTDEQGI